MAKKTNVEQVPKEPEQDLNLDESKVKSIATDDGKIDIVEGETCPVCGKKTLTLTEAEKDIPYFGKVFIFSMTCNEPECKYHKADIEAAEKKDPVKWTLDISSEKDMHIRVVKSAEATIKIPHIITITSGPSSNGYVTNVEGILNRVKKSIETARDFEDEDDDVKRKAKNMLKKLQKVTWGQETIKLIIEDSSGNSAIISDKAQKSALK